MPEIFVGKDIIDKLKPLVDKPKWKWFDAGTDLDELEHTTVMLTFQELERMPEAPLVMRVLSCTLTILTPKKDPRQRDAALIDDLLDLLNAIDQLANLSWSKAARGLGNGGRNIGYDITLQYRFEKDTP